MSIYDNMQNSDFPQEGAKLNFNGSKLHQKGSKGRQMLPECSNIFVLGEDGYNCTRISVLNQYKSSWSPVKSC